MYQNFLTDVNFHLFLVQLDQELAHSALNQGCLYCQAKLHRSDYPRSPLGLLEKLRDYYATRISFSCSHCRRRVTPMSVRFFGRRWYPAALFILISALTQGINKRRLKQIKKHLGISVSESTWRRWRQWWRDVFSQTPCWQQMKGCLPPTPEITQGPYPRVLLDVFDGSLEKKIIALLRRLSPLTTVCSAQPCVFERAF